MTALVRQVTRVITRYSLTHFPPPFFQDGENYAGKLYADVTLPVRETSMVVFDVVCTKKNASHQ